ncbi:hypothetical protein K2X30_10305 [bacterium]|nr:hypothetical protein [bacterium]
MIPILLIALLSWISPSVKAGEPSDLTGEVLAKVRFKPELFQLIRSADHEHNRTPGWINFWQGHYYCYETRGEKRPPYIRGTSNLKIEAIPNRGGKPIDPAEEDRIKNFDENEVVSIRLVKGRAYNDSVGYGYQMYHPALARELYQVYTNSGQLYGTSKRYTGELFIGCSVKEGYVCSLEQVLAHFGSYVEVVDINPNRTKFGVEDLNPYGIGSKRGMPRGTIKDGLGRDVEQKLYEQNPRLAF